jgi:hypothetical protein
MMVTKKRMVCQFSCGAASAVATKWVLQNYAAEDVLIVNAFVKEEDGDNRRFLKDCERWFGKQVQVLANEKYGASTDEVWRRKRYIKGPKGAPCSLALKRELLASIALPGDINVIGFTRGEEDRLLELEEHFPDQEWFAPCIEQGLNHEDCLTIVDRNGIVLPLMYRMGYPNANCVGCPKGGENYWKEIRHDFPQRFIQIQAIQEEIGPGASFLRFRSGPRKDERMSLAELPSGRGDMKQEPDFHCSFFCDLAGFGTAS